jgi:hypothetical protein
MLSAINNLRGRLQRQPGICALCYEVSRSSESCRWIVVVVLVVGGSGPNNELDKLQHSCFFQYQ